MLWKIHLIHLTLETDLALVKDFHDEANMNANPNYVNIYDTVVVKLTQTPNDPVLQHRAVLALARAGSLDFAWAEYRRYGLDKIATHQDAKLLEDIMGLGARLLKDLFLTSSGKAARDYALQSSEKYEAAFKLTGGFYSGINAATMGLMGGMDAAMIASRAQNIMRQLPPLTELDKETLYFIEATRAEALLLLGETYKARNVLRGAIRHDPQNYAAHASTLRQFKMILEKGQNEGLNEDMDWLSIFEPPKPAHFAGHLFKIGPETKVGSLSSAAQDKLKIDISDAIQLNDIGFGYGSLAAGSDIIIAEVLLDEGCALHITLPVQPEVFLTHSVEPFGQDWAARFKRCWDAASSRDVVTHSTMWPQYETDRFSGNITMGKAILQAEHLSVDALQLLVWDERQGDKGTARNASDWLAAGRERIVVPYPGPRPENIAAQARPSVAVQASLFNKTTDQALVFPDIYAAVEKALEIQKNNAHSARIGLHIDILPSKDLGEDSADTGRELAANAVPGGVLISEAVVSFLLLNHSDEFSMDYMGRLGSDDGVRAFALKRKG
ncbi:MAG: TRAFs-binding domain-containing protein [Hellea sp.]